MMLSIYIHIHIYSNAIYVHTYIHTYVHTCVQISTVVDSSQLSELHFELLSDSSDRKKVRSCDDDNAGIALRKPYPTFRDDDDDGDEEEGNSVELPL
jgi:hypothetical protein